MSEFGLIAQIAKRFASIDHHGWEAIGDDCTVLPIGDEALVITTDMLIEGVHFLRDKISPEELGRKSLAVNLSDVAAMGVRPIATLLSVALPKDATDEWAERFTAGYHALSEEYSVALVGGDTTSSECGIAINVVAIGRGPLVNVKRRSAACVGDIVYVGGELGASARGLKDIFAGNDATPNAAVHRNPQAQVAEGEWLGSRAEVHAMMDLSDGLASDLCHILRASKCGAELYAELIPAVDGDIESAVAGGEDYKLLFTVAETSAAQLESDFLAHFGRPIYRVGRIVESDSHTIRWFSEGKEFSPDWKGFTHF